MAVCRAGERARGAKELWPSGRRIPNLSGRRSLRVEIRARACPGAEVTQKRAQLMRAVLGAEPVVGKRGKAWDSCGAPR